MKSRKEFEKMETTVFKTHLSTESEIDMSAYGEGLWIYNYPCPFGYVQVDLREAPLEEGFFRLHGCRFERGNGKIFDLHMVINEKAVTKCKFL